MATTALFFTAMALLLHAPVMVGLTPFPADIFTRFPVYGEPEDHRVPLPHAPLGDLLTQAYPWRALLGAALAEGTIPLWNRHNLLGTPFQAEPLTGVFYPPNLLFALLPAPLAWGLGYVWRAAAAGAFTALLGRRLGMCPSGAWCAGLAFTYGGFMVGWGGWAQSEAAVWLPASLLATSFLLHRHGIAAAAVCWCIAVLAGHPEIALYVVGVVGADALVRCALLPPPTRRAFVLRLAIAVVLSGTLAAVQILPSTEWLARIRRSLDSGELGATALPRGHLLAFLSRDDHAHPNSAGIAIPEGQAYAGALTLLAACLAPLARRRRHVLLASALVGFCCSSIYGVGPGYWLTSQLPVLRALPNTRLLLVAGFAVALLAGLGVTAALEAAADRARRRRALALLLAGTSVALAACGMLARRQASPPVHGWLASVGWSAGFVLAGAAALAAALALPGARRALPALLVGLSALDLGTAAFEHVPFVRPEELFPPSPPIGVLQRVAGDHRVVSVDRVWPNNAEVPYGLASPVGYDYGLRLSFERMKPLVTSGLAPNVLAGALLPGSRALLDELSIRYLVCRIRPAGTVEKRLGIRRIWEDGNVVILENPTAQSIVRATTAQTGKPATIDGVSWSRNGVEATVEAPEEVLLSVGDCAYPGWRAWVDGAPAEPRVQGWLKVIDVPAGRHAVRLAFVPGSFRLGLFVSLLGICACAALAWPATRIGGVAPR